MFAFQNDNFNLKASLDFSEAIYQVRKAGCKVWDFGGDNEVELWSATTHCPKCDARLLWGIKENLAGFICDTCRDKAKNCSKCEGTGVTTIQNGPDDYDKVECTH